MSRGLKLLLLDNHDSFTWNLAQYLQELGAELRVELNDAIEVDGVLRGGFDGVVVSPGPGRPERAGICLELVHAVAGRLPLLGVCLGHQALAQAYGARIVESAAPMHGKTSVVVHDGCGLFRGLPQGFEATRYHSLVVDPRSLDPAFEITARTPDGVIMSIRHRELPLWGVQFHPESVLTREGKPLLANFLALAGRPLRPVKPRGLPTVRISGN